MLYVPAQKDLSSLLGSALCQPLKASAFGVVALASNFEFSQSIIEQLGYYVYLLIDPESKQIFYIGKGTGNRIYAHINAALSDESPTDKLEKIREIISKSLEVQHILHRHGLTEKEALEVEAALIDLIGLSGLTNQVQGHNSDDRGQMLISEAIAKYQAPAAHISESVILITVNQFYRRGMEPSMLYEITRGKWVIGLRRDKAKFAFAVYKGIIREVYEISNWQVAPSDVAELKQAWASKHLITASTKQKNRWQFVGVVSAGLQKYVGCSTENYQTVGAQNPIRYVNC